MADLPKDDIVSKAIGRMQVSREYCQPYFNRFLDNYKHYFMRIIDEAVEGDEDAYPLYSQLHLPISFQIVETILPRMFIRLPNFRVKTDLLDDEVLENKFTHLIRSQMNHQYLMDDPIYLRLATGMKENFIAGNMWGEVPWYKKEVEVEEWQPYSPELGIPPSWEALPTIQKYGLRPRWMLVKTKRKVIDAPVFEHRSVFHVYPDAGKKRVSDLRYVFVEEFMDMEQIMDMVNVDPQSFDNIDNLKTLAPTTTKGDGVNYDNEIASIFGSSDQSLKETGVEKDGQYKVWFMKEKGRLDIIVNESLRIRSGANPHGDGKLGMFLMKDIPVPHELYAWGEVDPIKRIEDNMSDQWNMRSDAIFYDLLKMWEVNTTALVDGEEFIPEPGTVVEVKEAGAIKPLETGSTKATAYREYQEWESLIQNTTGVTDYATGQSDPSMNKTRGGVELLQQAANHRFAFKLQIFEQLGLKAMGTMYVERNMRYFDDAEIAKIKGDRTVISPDEIRMMRGAKFEIEAGSTESQYTETQLNKWKFVTDAIGEGKAPFDNLSQKAKDKAGTKVLNALEIENPEEVLERAPVQPMDPNALLNAGGANVEQNKTALPTGTIGQ